MPLQGDRNPAEPTGTFEKPSRGGYSERVGSPDRGDHRAQSQTRYRPDDRVGKRQSCPRRRGHHEHAQRACRHRYRLLYPARGAACSRNGRARRDGHLAAGLTNAGILVTVITDTPCAKAVWAVVDALPMPVNLEVVSTTESSVLRLRQYLETTSNIVCFTRRLRRKDAVS